MKTYKEYIIRTEPFLPDLLTGLLWELNISGLTEEDYSIKVYAENNNLSKNIVQDFLLKLENEKLIEKFSVEESEFENKNWNEEWERNLSVIKITDKIIIKPSFKEYTPEENEIVITIDPKMSFGTGEHQTTKLMVKLLEKYIKHGMAVLDIGSGTAILSIAAVKLGAKSALAIDNDELCYVNGIENSRLSKVEDKVKVLTGELNDISEDGYDLIFANIQKNVLLNIAGDIRKKIRDNGFIILSGLYLEDEDEIIDHYRKHNFFLVEKDKMDEWIAMVLKG